MASYASDFNPVGGFKMLHSFLHPEEAYKHAGRAAERGYNEAKGYEQPFIQQGQEQYAPLNQARESLMHPEQLQNQWAEGYETSPYAQRLMEQSRGLGEQEASSMGLMGSSGALQNIQQGASDIASKDRQQYMNDLMQKYLSGIGIGQNIYGTGANMGANLGGQAIGQGQNMAQMKYGQYAAPGQLFGNLLRAGVGAAVGGPSGAAIASQGQGQGE